MEVRIPAGVIDGSRVRVAGEGGHGTGSGPSGDLYLRVQLRPHPLFDVKGRDVFTRTRVPLIAAVLGGEVDVVTPEGKALRLKLPAGTQGGQKFRLRGHGFPALGKPAERGDLYASVDIDVPKTLTDEERALYEHGSCEGDVEANSEYVAIMNLNKFTEKAQEAVVASPQLASEYHHAQVEPEHLLVALVEQAGGVVPSVLRKLNVDLAQMGKAVRDYLAKQPTARGGAEPSLLAAPARRHRGGPGRRQGHAGRVRQHRAPAARPARRAGPVGRR